MTLRKVEIFTAGCSLCEHAVQRVRTLACPSCRVEVLDMDEQTTQEKARRYGVTRVPTVVVDGRIADCCQAGVINLDTLRALGVGVESGNQ